jgi:nicotinamidase-related amidase
MDLGRIPDVGTSDDYYTVGAWRRFVEANSSVKPIEVPPIDVGKAALVLVDIQQKMVGRSVDPATSIRTEQRETPLETKRWRWIEEVAFPNSVRLLNAFRAHSRAVLHFAAGPQHPQGLDLPPSYRQLLQPAIKQAGQAVHWATPQYAFPPELSPREGEIFIRKRTRGGFTHTEAEGVLRALGVTDLVIIGGATEACVEATARGASDCGFNVFVVEDAVIPVTPLNQLASLAAIACFFGGVCTTGEVLEVLGQARA